MLVLFMAISGSCTVFKKETFLYRLFGFKSDHVIEKMNEDVLILFSAKYLSESYIIFWI